MQKELEITQRKKSVSVAGICATRFTKTLARKKASVDKNIARTPGERNFVSVFSKKSYGMPECLFAAAAIVTAIALI